MKPSVILIAFICSLASCQDVKNYDGFSVLRLTPSTLKQLEFLKELTESNLNLDFWTEPNAINKSCDIMVSPKDKPFFESQLKFNKINSQVLIPDVQSAIAYEKIEFREFADGDDEYFTKYQTLENVEKFIKKIASENPDIASVEVIGKSFEKRDLTVLKLGNANAKQAIWLDSTIHAREWITTATNAWIVKQLVDGHKKNDKEIVKLLNDFQWYFLLVLNVDGYHYTHTKDRMWRKSRSTHTGTTCVGIDLNRNFDVEFGGVGTSKSPCVDTYCGPNAFSESESKAVSDFVIKHKDTFKIFISLHSYSQLWMHPYGFSKTKRPQNYADLEAKSKIGAKALQQVYNTPYTVGAPPDILYAVSGGSFDWAYEKAGIKHSYTLELRDTGFYGFLLPPKQIVPTGTETWAGLKAMIQAIAKDLGL